MTDNVEKLHVIGFAPTNKDIAAHLRQMAEWITESDAVPLRTICLVIETADGELLRRSCGTPIDVARMVGLLHLAATSAAIDASE